MRTRLIFKLDFLNNVVANQEILFFILDLFFHCTIEAGTSCIQRFVKKDSDSCRNSRRKTSEVDFQEIVYSPGIKQSCYTILPLTISCFA